MLMAASLPFWCSWLVRAFGGHFTEWVYHSNFNSFVSATFVVSAALVVRLLRVPGACFGLRFTFGYLLVIAWLLAAVFYGSNCTEKLFLGTYGYPIDTREHEQDACGA